MRVIGNDHLHYSENRKADDMWMKNNSIIYVIIYMTEKSHRDETILTRIQLPTGDAR